MTQTRTVPDPDLAALLGRMKRALHERVGSGVRLVLFGSRARGDAGPDSDVDLLVVLPDRINTVATREAARDAVYDFALESDYVFSALVASESQVRAHRGALAFAAIEREGVAI